MEDGNLKALRGDDAQARVRIAQHEHRVRPLGGKERVGLGDDVAHRLPQVVPHHAQVVVRLTDTQVVEEDLVELVVVVLPGVDDGEVEVLVGLADHLRELDDLRACAHDDHEFKLAHI